MAAPFAKEIFLIETHVAGTSHVPIKEIEPILNSGDSLVLRRETGNIHDEHAILILTEGGEKLGYIPRDRNEILARLMDAGNSCFRASNPRNGTVTGLTCPPGFS